MEETDMKGKKKLTALLLSAIMCIATVMPAYADFYMEPQGIKGLLVSTDNMVDDAADLGVKQIICNYHVSWANNTARNAAYDQMLQKAKNYGISVTMIVLNDWQTSNPDILPVSEPTGAAYYGFNTSTDAGVEATKKAAEKIADNFKDLVSNWVIGNEINSGVTYNSYGRAMDINEFCSNYASGFRIWYDAIKASNGLARVFIPYDFSWNNSADNMNRYNAKDMFPILNFLLSDTDYGIAWHAYPQDATNPAYWNDTMATESENTAIINLKNLHILTDYMQRPEMLSPEGTVRHLILSEQGFSSQLSDGSEVLELQAEAITRAYNDAAANPYVEAFMLNRDIDSKTQVEQLNYAFGLQKTDPNSSLDEDPSEKKPSWEAYKNVDQAAVQ